MSDPDILTGGSWQVVRGVKHWVPDGPTPVEPQVDVASLLACPFCRAQAGQTCKSRGGNPVLPHTSRLVGRYCQCGAPMPYRKGTRRKLCDTCRHEEAKASKRRTRARRARCGTDSGYRRHRRLGEQPCDRCLEGHAYATRRNAA